MRTYPPKIECICPECGVHYWLSKSRVLVHKFCSLRCAIAGRSGTKSPLWKGGRCIPKDPKAAISLTVAVGAKAPRALEHRVIAERALGHALPKGAEVHHFNVNRHDNRGVNLVICENHAYHYLLENRGRRLRDTGSLDLKRCRRCNDIKPLALFNHNKSVWDGKARYCKECSHQKHREEYLRKKETQSLTKELL